MRHAESTSGAGKKQLREQAVALRAGLGGDALRDLELKGGDEPFRRAVGFGQFDEDGRSDGVGEIGDQLPGGPIARVLLQPAQGVGGEQREVRRGGETLAQHLDQACVLLDGEDRAGLREQQFGERAEPGADLEHVVRGHDLAGRDDAAELVAVVQEILAERLGELDAAEVEPAAHLGKVHRIDNEAARTRRTAKQGGFIASGRREGEGAWHRTGRRGVPGRCGAAARW